MPIDNDPQNSILESAALLPAAPATTLLDSVRHRRLWFEIAVVASVAIVPDVFNAIFLFFGARSSASMTFPLFALRNLVRSAPAILVTLYVIDRSELKPADFGLRAIRIPRDFMIAVGAVLAGYALYYAMWISIARLSPSLIAVGVTGGGNYKFIAPKNAEWVLLFLMAAVNGFAEEVVMRGYLIRRLEQALGTTAGALVLSTLLFAAYHLYQGSAGVINGVAISIVFGLIYIRTRRLWPIAIAHAMLDVIGFVQIAANTK